MRKKVLIFLALLMFMTPLFAEMQKVDAVAGKVISTAAKKVAKEVVKDQAVRQSMSMVLNYEYKPKSSEKVQKPKESFTMVCLPENRKSDNTCTKPMQVKKNLTTQDKKNIGQEAGKILDKKINHRGWKKFVDWFLPIWILGLAVTTVDLLLDGDLSSFFADVGYEALVNLGLITNLAETPDTTLINKENFKGNIYDPDDISESDLEIINNRYLGINYDPIELPKGITYTHTIFNNGPQGHIRQYVLVFESTQPYYFEMLNGVNYKLFPTLSSYLFLEFNTLHLAKPQPNIPFIVNLNPIASYASSYHDKRNIELHKDFLVFDERLYFTKYKFAGINDNQVEHLISLAEPFFNSLVVAPPEPMPELKPEGVPVTKPGTTVTVPSPESVPVVDKNTGTQVRPGPGSTVDNPIWTTPDGTPVHEDDIIVDEIEIEETPDGDKIKAPESNPDIEEGTIPNPGDNITPPDGGDPDDGITPPEEGPGCDTELKLPRLPLLFNSLSESFPFSIPFDLKSGFDGIFLKMGDEKPVFDFSINVGDNKHDFDIRIPDYFDDWMPFVHSVLLFIFDVGLLYAIYRFIRT